MALLRLAQPRPAKQGVLLGILTQNLFLWCRIIPSELLATLGFGAGFNQDMQLICYSSQ